MTTNHNIKKVLLTLAQDGMPRDIYHFHQQFAILPGDLLLLVEQLEQEGFISRNGTVIRITPNGKKELLINKKKYFSKQEKYWECIPESLKINIDLNQAIYIPKKFNPKKKEQ